jgi:hypothetical protein
LEERDRERFEMTSRLKKRPIRNNLERYALKWLYKHAKLECLKGLTFAEFLPTTEPEATKVRAFCPSTKVGPLGNILLMKARRRFLILLPV